MSKKKIDIVEGIKSKKGLIGEFKEFISRGNVIDLAVGVVMGSAFTAIVNSLVKGILQPLINMIPLGQDGKSLQVVLRDPVIDATTGAVVKEAVIMDFGAVISAIVTFLLTALVLFLIVKAINKAREIGGKEKARLEQLAQKVTKKNGDAETTEAPADVAVAEEAPAEPAPVEVAPVEPAPDKTQELLSAILDELKAQRADKE